MGKQGKYLLTCGQDRVIYPEPLREEGLVVTQSRVWEATIFTLHERDEANSQFSKYLPFEQ